MVLILFSICWRSPHATRKWTLSPPWLLVSDSCLPEQTSSDRSASLPVSRKSDKYLAVPTYTHKTLKKNIPKNRRSISACRTVISSGSSEDSLSSTLCTRTLLEAMNVFTLISMYRSFTTSCTSYTTILKWTKRPMKGRSASFFLFWTSIKPWPLPRSHLALEHFPAFDRTGCTGQLVSPILVADHLCSRDAIVGIPVWCNKTSESRFVRATASAWLPMLCKLLQRSWVFCIAFDSARLHFTSWFDECVQFTKGTTLHRFKVFY